MLFKPDLSDGAKRRGERGGRARPAAGVVRLRSRS